MVSSLKDSNGDLKSLYPKDRCDQGKSRAMDEETCLSLIELKLSMAIKIL
jgi:hypothetical protein